MACDIRTLASEGAFLNGLDQIDDQAGRLYVLALILKQLGGADLTDVCALSESMRPYESMTDYQLGAAEMTALSQLAQSFGVVIENIDPAVVQKSLSCAHCCQVTQRSMKIAEIYLLCAIAEAQEAQP